MFFVYLCNMKKQLLSYSLFLSLSVMAQERVVNVSVTNDWDKSRKDEPVVVKLADVKKLGFDVSSATVSLNGKEIPCQLDDMNGDLRNDELVFLADIDSKTTNTYSVTLRANGTQKAYLPRVWGALILRDRKDIHPKLKQLEAPGTSNLFNDVYMHGSVFESELVGWRVYFDQRQNLDLYGKKLRRIEIPTTEFYTTAEQLSQDYGVDVLWAGGAVGCGTFRGWNSAPTLIDSVKVRGQRMIADGPLRTVVELKDLGWQVKPTDTKTLNMHQYYIQYAGHRDIEISINFDEPLGDELFCTGVQKVGVTATDSVRCGHTPQGFIRNGITASWGCDYPDMGKKQLWGPEAIGLATYVPQQYIKDQSESELNYLYVIGNKGGTNITYHTGFCAAKEKDGYHTANEWFNSLDEWKASFEHPVKISIK